MKATSTTSAVLAVLLPLFQGSSSAPVKREVTVDDTTNSVQYNGDGESCRLDLIDKWLIKSEIEVSFANTVVTQDPVSSATSTRSQILQHDIRFDIQSLLDVQESTLYKAIVEDCDFFLNAYNTAAGDLCVYEQTYVPEVFYSQLWKIGPVNMDAEWLLAVDLLLSNELQDFRPLVPCSDSCYMRSLEPDRDCQQSESSTGGPFLNINAITSISQEPENPGSPFVQPHQGPLCNGWLQADRAYQNLRLCASESNVSRTMIKENERNRSNNNNDDNDINYTGDIAQASAVAGVYSEQRQKQAICAVSALDGICLELVTIDENDREEVDDFDPAGSTLGSDDWIESGADCALGTAAKGIEGIAVLTVVWQIIY